MVKAHGRAAAMAAAGLLLVISVYLWTRATGPVAPPASGVTSRRVGGEEEIPPIGLARITAARPKTEAGRRDILNYGVARPRGGPEVAAVVPTPPPVTLPPTPLPVATPPPPAVPPLNVKYVGSLENKRGLRVAILLTDRKEILTGQVGETVANRFRIVKIGYESVDIQDVGSDRVRRIPFKGN